MKIVVTYFIDNKEPEVLILEIDPTTTIRALSEQISQQVGHNVLLIPMTLSCKHEESIGEYYASIQGGSCQSHFNAINPSTLTFDEQAILAKLNLCSFSAASHPDFVPDTDRFIRFITTVLPDDVREALLVRLADKISMFGATFHDRLTTAVKEHKLRSSIQLHPYPWQASGSSCVIAHENKLKELSVALVYNQRRDRREPTDLQRLAGIPDFYKLPEGYMHPKPCTGGEAGISLVSSDDMDEAEELMLKGLSMRESYEKIKQRNGDAKSSHSSDAVYDNSTKDCAIRESYEEVGLKIQPEQVQYISQREENRVIPCITFAYLVKYKTEQIEAPAMKVDGIEIREAVWSKLSAFCFVDDRTKTEGFHVASEYYDNEGDKHLIEVPMKYALMIAQSIRRFRDDDIQHVSQLDGTPLFSSRENLEARIKQILKNPRLNPTGKTLETVLGELPESKLEHIQVQNLIGETLKEKKENLLALSQLGRHADNYHKKVMALAGAFTCMSMDRVLTAVDIECIAHEGSEIEFRLLRNRARSRLFTLQQVSPNPELEEKQSIVET
jgi:ADP-ribose pyrophosphatase YjhB (NUDIX family)